MDKSIQITTKELSIHDIATILDSGSKLELSEEVISLVKKCRVYLDDLMQDRKEPIYGINTGFGSLYNQKISSENLSQLQYNLVVSHACGMGEEVDSEIVRLMLLLKILGLSKGHSGVQLLTLQRLVDYYNEGIYPVVFELGSLGASGDLAPLAHLSLPLIGLGEVNYQGEKYATEEINKKYNWEPISLQSKEGLALLNGTQFMSAFATHSLIRLNHLMKWGNLIATASLDAFDGRKEPFNEKVHQIRPHQGQLDTANEILNNLNGSQLIEQEKVHVQDPYSFRCIPQVHGATKDAVKHATSVVEKEINSVTDNPTIFYESDEVISAGNFHGQPLALVMDYLAIAIAEITSISERRIYKLVSGQRGLPPFLVKNAGLNSGFMIAQYAAASAVSQNKQLSTPASVDTIDSSNGQEDHVSMGANAATKLKRIIDNYERVIGIEWFTACQALEFRTAKSSSIVEEKKLEFRSLVPFIEEDTEMHLLMDLSRQYISVNKVD